MTEVFETSSFRLLAIWKVKTARVDKTCKLALECYHLGLDYTGKQIILFF